MADTENQETRADSDEISLIDLVVVLLRHWKIIVGVTLSAFTVTFLYILLSILLPPDISYLPNYYTSTTTLLFSSQSSSGLSGVLASSGLGDLASLAGIKSGGSSNSELAVAILKSNTTIDELNAVFDFTNVYHLELDAKSAMRSAVVGNITTAIDAKTGLINVSFKDTDPVFAMKVVNHLVEILDRRFMSLGGNRALEEKRLLETKLVDVQVEMSRLQRELQEFTTRYGVLSIEALATEQVTVMARLRAELIMKDIEIENYKKFSTIDDPVIRRLKSERDSISTALSEVESGKSGVLPSQKDIPSLTFEYARIQRDLLVQAEIFKLITQQYELSKMSADGQSPSFQVLELGEVADKKSGPARAQLLVIVTMASLFASIFLAFILEALRNIRANPETMAKLRGIAK